MYFCEGECQTGEKGEYIKTLKACDYSTPERSDMIAHCREHKGAHPFFSVGPDRSNAKKIKADEKTIMAFTEKTKTTHRFVTLDLADANDIENELAVKNPENPDDALSTVSYQIANMSPFVAKDGKEKVLFHLVKQA